MYVDYYRFMQLSIKNFYYVSFILRLFDQFRKIKIYIKMSLQEDSNLVHIKEENE